MNPKHTASRKILLSAIMAIATALRTLTAESLPSGPNLIFNSSFELGDKGWTGHRRSTLGEDGAYEYAGPAWTVDSSTAQFGGQSIRLENSKGSALAFFGSHDFLVEQGKTYTVSFWAKAAKENTSIDFQVRAVQVVFRRGPNGNILPDVGFNAGEFSDHRWDTQVRTNITIRFEWTRHVAAFRPGKDMFSYTLNFMLKESGPVWIDGVQVENGDLTDYSPASPIEVALYTPSLFQDTKLIEGTMAAISYVPGKSERTIPLILYDIYFGKELAVQNIQIHFDGAKPIRKSFEFKNEKFGYACVVSGLQPRITPPDFFLSNEMLGAPPFTKLAAGDTSYQSGAFFVSVPKPEFTPTGFKLGLTGTVDGSQLNWGVHRDDFGSPDEAARIDRASGSTVWRCWCNMLFSWSQVEPEKGKFTWAGADQGMRTAEKAGLPLMLVVGGDFRAKGNYGPLLPKWVKDRDRLGHPDGTRFDEWLPARHGKDDSFKIILPQLEDWRGHLSSIATRYKGRIAYYEILNEPNIWGLSPKYYVEYLQAAYEEIKKADPNAKVLGIVCTTDTGVKYESYISQCIELGAHKYMDCVSTHPYLVLDNSTPSQMDERRSLLQFFKKKGVPSSLWTGEDYYLLPDVSIKGQQRLTYDWPADVVSRFYLVDMGEGLAGSTPAHLDSFFNVPSRPYQYWGESQGSKTPNERFAVHASAARFVAGAEPLYTPTLHAGAVAYVFKKGDKLHSAVWNSRSKQKTEITLAPPKGSKVAIFDLMGNNMRHASTALTLPLDAKPYYLEWSGTTAEAVRDAFNASSISCEYPFRVERAVIMKDADAPKIAVSIENMSGRLISNASLSLSSGSFDETSALRIDTLADFKLNTFETPIKLKDTTANSITFSANADFGKPFSQSFNALLKTTANIRYVPQEFRIEKCVLGKVHSDHDLSAGCSLSLQNNGGIFQIAITVRDDVKGSDKVSSPYEQDCIEVFIDKGPLAGDGSKYTSECRQLTFPRKEGLTTLGDVTAEMRESPDGYTARIRIPVGISQKWIGLDIAIDDSDADRRKSQIVWQGTADNWNNRDGFGLVQIMRGLASRIDLVAKDAGGNPYKLRTDVNDAVGAEWTPNSFIFTPKDSGEVWVYLLSGYTVDKKERCWIQYRNVKAGDSLLIESAKTTHDKPGFCKLKVAAGVPVAISYEARTGSPVEMVETDGQK